MARLKTEKFNELYDFAEYLQRHGLKRDSEICEYAIREINELTQENIELSKRLDKLEKKQMTEQHEEPSLLEDLEDLSRWLEGQGYFEDADVCTEAIKEIKSLRRQFKGES